MQFFISTCHEYEKSGACFSAASVHSLSIRSYGLELPLAGRSFFFHYLSAPTEDCCFYEHLKIPFAAQQTAPKTAKKAAAKNAKGSIEIEPPVFSKVISSVLSALLTKLLSQLRPAAIPVFPARIGASQKPALFPIA